MTTNIIRRTALAGTVAMPAAMAPLAMAQAGEAVPAVTAMWEWNRRRLMEKEVLDMLADLERNLPSGAPEVDDFQ